MTSLFAVACLTFFLQDPFVVAPEAYKLQFENEWVRVVRVHYGPRVTIPPHDHPRGPTIYVYLTDNGPVRFMHTSNPVFLAERPPTKVGGFRLGYPSNETHQVESRSDQASEFLRVELKTERKDVDSFRGRFPPRKHSTGKSSSKKRFRNGQVSILRLTCAAQKECRIEGSNHNPWLLVSIGDASVKQAGADLRLKAGETVWCQAGKPIQFSNASSQAAEFLAIEFKTGPSSQQPH